MHVVAITELAPPSSSLAELAVELGTTLYELKLTLSAGLPAVVVATVDAAIEARATLALRRGQHRVVSCASESVVASSAMPALRDFRLDAAHLCQATASSERLPYADILALLRATHRSSETSVREDSVRKFRPGMAIATGGLVLSKTTKRQVVSKTETREAVLYIFRRSGAPPWILRERGARYAGLGSELRPTSLENFATTIRLLRERAPSAVYDERLVNGRSIRGVAEGIAASDLLAHLLALDALNRR
jgi:hypothetical protein